MTVHVHTHWWNYVVWLDTRNELGKDVLGISCMPQQAKKTKMMWEKWKTKVPGIDKEKINAIIKIIGR
jgi:hypothetical protein